MAPGDVAARGSLPGARQAQEASVTQQIADRTVTQQIYDRKGLRLSVESLGDPQGKPVFLLHGMPGSRGGPRPRHIVLYRLGIRLITFDRPGYPGSDRDPGREVASAAENVRAIADKFNFDRFSVVGRSAGGPHALACAALLPDRVISAAALASLAPRDANALDWEAGMTQSNVKAFRLAQEDPLALRAMLTEKADQVSRASEGLLRTLRPEMGEQDKKVIGDTELSRIIANNHIDALSNKCVDGWVDDVLALARPWGFQPAEITVPVKLWGGQGDVFSPVTHTYWLAEQISGAAVEIGDGKAHFGAVEILPSILTWLTKKANAGRSQELVP